MAKRPPNVSATAFPRSPPGTPRFRKECGGAQTSLFRSRPPGCPKILGDAQRPGNTHTPRVFAAITADGTDVDASPAQLVVDEEEEPTEEQFYVSAIAPTRRQHKHDASGVAIAVGTFPTNNGATRCLFPRRGTKPRRQPLETPATSPATQLRGAHYSFPSIPRLSPQAIPC